MVCSSSPVRGAMSSGDIYRGMWVNFPNKTWRAAHWHVHRRTKSFSNSLFMCFGSLLDESTIVSGALDGLFRGLTSSLEAVDESFSFVENTRVAIREPSVAMRWRSFRFVDARMEQWSKQHYYASESVDRIRVHAHQYHDSMGYLAY